MRKKYARCIKKLACVKLSVRTVLPSFCLMKAVGGVIDGCDSIMIKATVCHCTLTTYEMRRPIKIG